MKRLIVLLGVVGVSLSAVFVRWAQAPALMLALYRMAFSVLLLLPGVLFRHREELRALSRRDMGLCLASGAFLGLHFAAYFQALRWTSIAAAVVLVDTEVLFVALGTVLALRQRLTGRAWLAVLLAFSGSVAVAMSDAAGGGGAVRGDLIALAGAFCMAVYTMIGTVCRQRLSTTVYTGLVYGAAALTLLVLALVTGQPLTGCAPADLGAALGMAVFCTLLGHSVFSWGLRYLPAAWISTVKLLEPVFASLWGLALFGERPGLWVLCGGAVIILGILLYTSEPRKEL
jgi:drug/metabolite transporter (DMT)-like permease